MAVKFFGQYLVEKGLVSREKLLEALELQETTNLKFGEMALAMGLLTEDDIERVHRAQFSNDMRFGDIALKIGILTDAQVQQVLTRQQNSYLYIGQALVEVGALEKTELEKYLKDFQQDQAPYRVDRIAIPADVPRPDVWEIAADLTFKMLTRVAQLAYRVEQCRQIERLMPNHVVAAISLTGAVQARFFLSASEEIQHTIARAILKEENVSDEPMEVLDDTVTEFLNVIAGNVAAKAAQRGYKIEIDPPDVMHPDTPLDVPDGHVGLLFPIHASTGERIEMALFINRWGC